MGATTRLKAADDHILDAYLAPSQGRRRGGLVVLQEIFGVNDHIRAVADGFAADGFEVLAPALFDRIERGVEVGYDEPGFAKGREIRPRIELHESLMDIQAAVAELRGRDDIFEVGLVGYCWGGTLAWAAATRTFGISAAVCYYGSGIAKMLDRKPRCPVMMHFGEQDRMIPMDEVAQIRAAFPDIPVHAYPAGHGFNCDQRDSFHPESATLARERTMAFLAEHVG